VVHLGVVIFAVGLIAATSFAQRTELALARGKLVRFDGHTFVFEGIRNVANPQRRASEVVVLIDGGGPFLPAASQYGGSQSETIGTPAIDSGFFGDVYVTFDAVGGSGPASGAQVIPNLPAGSIALGVVVEPLIVWMWAGGLLIGLGGLLALFPGGRRRPTEPASSVGGGSHELGGALDGVGVANGAGNGAGSLVPPARVREVTVSSDAP
jgi:cytochrome c-type biogenesis protein CcmF